MNVAFFLIGGAVGLPLLDLDQYLSPRLELPENFFHSAKVYSLIFVLAVFTATASGSMTGKGIVLAMLIHGLLNFTEKSQKIFAAVLLAVAVILLLL